jgi:hypothetical protein
LSDTTELKEKYGSFEELHRQSSGPRDLERRLQEFNGVGPVGVNIFLRENGFRTKRNDPPRAIQVSIGTSFEKNYFV